MDIKKTVKTLTMARKAYYAGTPLMSDAEYDKLEDKLKEVDPTNDFFTNIGAPVKSKKVKFEDVMGSLQKDHSPDKTIEWLKKNKIVTFLVEEKLDGAALEVRYLNGKINLLVTRGDGLVGQDVTHHATAIANLPKEIEIKDDFSELRLSKNGVVFL